MWIFIGRLQVQQRHGCSAQVIACVTIQHFLQTATQHVRTYLLQRVAQALKKARGCVLAEKKILKDSAKRLQFKKPRFRKGLHCSRPAMKRISNESGTDDDGG
jgi:hypothetical protein